MGEVMLEWRTILCGVDGSKESLHAAKLGAMIAKRLSSRLLGLWVIPRHQVFQLGIHRAEGKAELAADARALLTGIQNETGLPMEQLILEGDPADTILEIAAKRSCELIVVGRRGLSGVERWLLGSVATKVVSHATSTILASKGDGAVRDAPLERTLCGLDGSPESERAGIESLGLVALLGGTIRFAHVRNAAKGAEVDPLAGDHEPAETLLARFCGQARRPVSWPIALHSRVNPQRPSWRTRPLGMRASSPEALEGSAVSPAFDWAVPRIRSCSTLLAQCSSVPEDESLKEANSKADVRPWRKRGQSFFRSLLDALGLVSLRARPACGRSHQ